MTERRADHEIDRVFLDRTSPRSFTAEALPRQDLLRMLEAARWSPSSSNVQPWRFVYALRDTPQWEAMLATLMPGNQSWARHAGALIMFMSQIHITRNDEKVVSTSHAFDTGAAWASFAFQAEMMGYATHAMGGFFADKARIALGVPDDFAIDAAVAVGKRGPVDSLPQELREREAPTQRRPLSESLFHGRFGTPDEG